jgi:hypothetical protein
MTDPVAEHIHKMGGTMLERQVNENREASASAA